MKINGSLSKGSASALDVALCEVFECAPGAPESMSVAVEWAGLGPTQSLEAVSDPFCSVNWRSRGSLRWADAAGTVDGVPFAVPSPPESGATLQSDSFSTVERCRAA